MSQSDANETIQGVHQDQALVVDSDDCHHCHCERAWNL